MCFMYVCVCTHVSAVPAETKREHRILQSYKLLCVVSQDSNAVVNAGPLEEQQMLIAKQNSSHSLFLII